MSQDFELKPHLSIDLQKMRILAKKKKNHLFRWSSFWTRRVCKQAKLSHLGHRKPARIHWKASIGRRFVPHSQRADVVWSWGLAPLHYYLWGADKDYCYADKPETIDALKDSICEAIGEIQLQTIDNVLKNSTDRVGYCMASRGSHLNEIIFHY